MENVTEGSLTNTIAGPHILETINVEGAILEIKDEI